ncbi:conserved Plasmodium protein, unknown function [Plasmodium berghei]|uniref:Uncharacterized protein n=2 Tax=Plasmodium berghei TaxID=5821 RepID=A0A509AW96_PLABA|nr:conserved Plasmodium protein, unknown function [Plasmodium berghei ANKA]CXJ27601.1 conserved Plasmodium protein, unknown function [Plasmodium berghei]SCM27008.1 conserved Plasmodium protein, unknown function [Plasmodium berghei]SCN28748.1 conserved Plasmodium protein, unknown function [Plasmodium berghei]SCO63012.1 conserved Plasmodium protein, unknown function [Plasmodium berghei]SCO64495.1 conserved Plasmodium protein, unknown function [Plasmodium berghei]|eukprot:XP_034424394.1 conserved Plasmodium protein, unknown function [Plasmodium berghei ANKA]
MGNKNCEETYITRDNIDNLLNSPNIIYKSSSSFDESIINTKPSKRDRLIYRIEYLPDGTSIYYTRKISDIKKMFCCY